MAMVKRSREYLFAVQLDPEVDAVAPNPDDITISKRAWDVALQKWRLSLRALARLSASYPNVSLTCTIRNDNDSQQATRAPQQPPRCRAHDTGNMVERLSFEKSLKIT